MTMVIEDYLKCRVAKKVNPDTCKCVSCRFMKMMAPDVVASSHLQAPKDGVDSKVLERREKVRERVIRRKREGYIRYFMENENPVAQMLVAYRIALAERGVEYSDTQRRVDNAWYNLVRALYIDRVEDIDDVKKEMERYGDSGYTFGDLAGLTIDDKRKLSKVCDKISDTLDSPRKASKIQQGLDMAAYI